MVSQLPRLAPFAADPVGLLVSRASPRTHTLLTFSLHLEAFSELLPSFPAAYMLSASAPPVEPGSPGLSFRVFSSDLPP